jgi:hypothetical protein
MYRHNGHPSQNPKVEQDDMVPEPLPRVDLARRGACEPRRGVLPRSSVPEAATTISQPSTTSGIHSPMWHLRSG